MPTLHSPRLGFSLLLIPFFVSAGCASGESSAPSPAAPAQPGSGPDSSIECAIDANCDDGETCNGVEICDAGVCMPGAPLVDGTSCDDGSLCTTLDACSAGSCQGDRIDCSAMDGVCLDGTCDESDGTCTAMLAEDGASCDDMDACTITDECISGVCGGSAVDCSAMDTMCTAGICDPSDGGCSTTPLSDGTACDDGFILTEMDTCSAGVCAGTTPSSDFPYTGALATYTVPDGVTRLRIEAVGASGGDACNDSSCSAPVLGGGGGLVSAIVDVTPGDVITVLTGAQPSTPRFGVDGCGSGGGGASIVTRGRSLSDATVSDVLVVAGGGGGAGGYGAHAGGAALATPGTGRGGAAARIEGGGGGGIIMAGASAGTTYGQGGDSLLSGGAGGAGASSESCTGNAGGFWGGGGGGNDDGGGGGGYTGGTAGNRMPSQGGGSYAVDRSATYELRAERGHGVVSLTPSL